MVQNLKIGKKTSSVTLTSSDTDASSDFTLNNKLSDGKFHSYTVDGVPDQNNNSEYYCTDEYGCYYNWYTSTAGTGTTSTTSGETSASICPAGWKLPSSSQFSALYSRYPSSTQMLVANPTTTTENIEGSVPGFLFGGFFHTGGSYGLGVHSYYWSRSIKSSQFAFNLHLDSSSVGLGYEKKYIGYAVRCIKEVKPSMQEQTISSLNTAMPNEGDTAVYRDDQEYIVGKAADGNYWMLQNLKLGKNTTSTTLTSADSDVSSDFVLNNKLSDGKFHYSTVDGADYQNNSSEYYCTNDYGCYYNWYTSTAGTGTTSVSSGDASSSICPAGWRLPSSSQFSALYSQYPSVAQMLVADPTTVTENISGTIPGLLLGGYYISDGAAYIGSFGYYWSRSAVSAQGAYELHLSSSNVNPASNSAKYDGFAVRCVKESPSP